MDGQNGINILSHTFTSNSVPPLLPSDKGGAKNAAWMSWIPNLPTTVTGTNGATIGFFQRFAASDLATYAGQYLTKIKYQPYSFDGSTNPITQFSAYPRIRVYVGGSYNGTTFTGGTMVADVEAVDFSFNWDNLVELTLRWQVR